MNMKLSSPAPFHHCRFHSLKPCFMSFPLLSTDQLNISSEHKMCIAEVRDLYYCTCWVYLSSLSPFPPPQTTCIFPQAPFLSSTRFNLPYFTHYLMGQPSSHPPLSQLQHFKYSGQVSGHMPLCLMLQLPIQWLLKAPIQCSTTRSCLYSFCLGPALSILLKDISTCS